MCIFCLFRLIAQDVVITDGGRFDVHIEERKRTAVYWKADVNEVRRCSWFYKGVDSRFVPYAEDVAEQLEDEYRDAANSGQWHRTIPLVSGETVVFHGPSVIVHYMQSTPTENNWQNSSVTVCTRDEYDFSSILENVSFFYSQQNVSSLRTRVVKRGIDEFSIEDGEPAQVDHILFMIHGIGSACDLKFRQVEEVGE